MKIEGLPQLIKSIEIPLCDAATNCATGSGVLFAMRGQALKGEYALSGAYLELSEVGATGVMSVQLVNVTDNTNVFSTEITVDSGELSSDDADTPFVIGAGAFSYKDRFVPLVTAVHTTPAKGGTLILDLVPQ